MTVVPLGAANATEAGGVEVIRHQGLYDTSEIGAGTTQVDFFNVPMNGALPISATVKANYTYTNMLANGLSKGQRFRAHALRIWSEDPFGTVADLPSAIAQTLFYSTVIEIAKTGVVIQRMPTLLAAGGAGLDVFQENGAAALNYAGGNNQPYAAWQFKSPFVIGDNEPFRVSILLRTASTLAATHIIMAHLDGEYLEPTF